VGSTAGRGRRGIDRPLGLLVAIVALLALTAPAHAAFPGANGKIAFVRGGTVTNDIWTMNANGSGQAKLTNTGDGYEGAKWSPEGGRLLTWNNDIYVVDAANASATRITTGFYPTWLPDGQRIGFWDGTLLTVNADGTGRRPVSGSPCCIVNPAWSPDGRKIAFEQEYIAPDGETINTAIYVMNSDATGVTRLTFDDDHDGYQFDNEPDWSPDGTKIAFGRETGVNVISAGGGIPLPIAPGGGGPVWSPDGQKITFVRAGIWVMNADGTAQIPLTSDSTDLYPSWQPLPGSSPPPPYPTPKLAGTVRAALVSLFIQCGTPANPTNASHATPLAVGSCDPPKRSSAAHFGAQAAGFAQLAVVYGDTNPANGDQADVTVRASLSDVQTAAGADYDPNPGGADATLATRLRFTDRANGASGTDPGTAGEFDFLVPVDCTATAASVGSTCALDTTADAVTPGIIKENKATVIQTFRFRLNDSGANGIRGDGDDKQFAMQGVFVP
jgi:hypothetical protein